MSAPSISKTEEAALPVIAAGDDANAGSTQSADDAESGPQANMPALVTEHSAKKPKPASMYQSVNEELLHSASTSAETAGKGKSYQEAPPEELLPPPDFKPFFTLIGDPETGEYRHPSVHYVFADDDQDILTDAALSAIDQSTEPDTETEERVVVVDMGPDGKTVTEITSLSPNWQHVKAAVGQAPSWGGAADGTDSGLMLKISGKVANDDNAQRLKQVRYLDDLVRSFGDGIDSLSEIIGKEGEASTHDN